MATISIVRRDDKTINITCRNADTGNPIDITGYSIFFTVKSNTGQSDDDALISKKVTSHTDPTNGQTSINLTHDDTNIEEGSYLYDFQLVSPGNIVSSVEHDVFNVLNDVTIRTT